jgi:hypothetical protein
MSSGCGGLPIWVYMSEVRGQPRTARRGAAIVLLALLAPQGTLLVLRTEPSLDLLVRSATVHLVVVSAISAEHMFTAGAGLAKASVTPEVAVGLDTPPEQLRSAFAMLLGEHMELIVEAQRASFAGAPQFQAAAAQVNANTTALTKAMAAIVGPTKAAEFQAAWANHVEGLLAYTAAAAGNDQHAKTVAKQNLDGFAERLALYFSDTVKKVLAADPLTKAITAHDQHLIDHVDAYAAKDYPRAQQMELEGYQQMLEVANTLVGAIQRTVKPQLPVGGSKTGGGGMACRRR